MIPGLPFVHAPDKPRILIVDDDVGTIRLLAQVVRELGDVRFATGGADALTAARTENPDLVLLDAEMEGMDGFETCAALRRLPGMEAVPILFVTSHTGVAVEIRALAAGAVDFITKPFHPHIVEARVRTHLALKQRTDALMRLATMDGLTGIANRRAFDGALAQETERLVQGGVGPLSLILADVDHFKRYNDFYGHQAGDDCLRAVAGALSGALRRPGEIAARFGGEEFAILLPGHDADAAIMAAERLRRAVAALCLAHVARPDGDLVTISAGAASLTSPGDAASLVAAADQALYRAKASGRNRVAMAG
ncbi:diguanylate cyclase domain-containing protein [Niveispirillum lacus]|uniref:diguanylate cyclase domain-containing protein n=1 Tax=Niveispirillum lacus TaxID=1981099 RepID=UPI001FEAF858|nr:diguanylate cyclase [Niveispirillum lacus]